MYSDKDYLGMAILTVLLCCCSFVWGIVVGYIAYLPIFCAPFLAVSLSLVVMYALFPFFQEIVNDLTD